MKKSEWSQYNWNILEDFLIKGAPPSVYYIPNFITTDEEEYIMQHVSDAPKPKWTQLSNRRVQDYGGIPHSNGLIPDAIPSWLLNFMDRVSNIGIFGSLNGKSLAANHCLINEYEPGCGIMPHSDGPIFTPIITTISCGSHTILEFYQEKDSSREMVSKILLERCSLVILKDDMYTKYLHGISDVRMDVIDKDVANIDAVSANLGDSLERKTRVSLTIRNVPRILKSSLLSLTKNLK